MNLQTYASALFLEKASYYGIFALLFLLSICGCNKPQKTDSHKEDKVEIFFRKLPIENVDSVKALIEKHITDKTELAYLHERILDTLDFFSTRKYPFAYLDYLEKKIDTLNPTLMGALYAAKGKAYYYGGKTDSSFLLLNKGIKLLIEGNDSSLICRAYINISKLYSMQNAILLGTENTLMGLKYVPKLVHDPRYPNNNNIQKMQLKDILLSFYAKKDTQKGKQLAQEILLEIKEIGLPNICKTLAYKTLALCFFKSNDLDSALWAAQQNSDLFYKYKEFQTAYGAYNLACSWNYAKQTEKAIKYFALGKHIADSLNNKTASQSCALNLGDIYLKRGELEKAQLYYAELQDNQLFQGNKVLFKALTDSLMILQLKKGNISQGLSYFYKSKALANSLNEIELNFIWADMNIRYQTNEKEKKINQLALDKRGLQIQALIIALLLLLLLSISAWRFYRYRQKQVLLANRNILLESEKKLLESQQQILEIAKQLQEQEIEMHKRQLNVFQENMLAKNALIDEMQVQIKEVIHNSANLAEKEMSKNREKLNKLKILTEKDWHIYLAHFEKVYPHFLEKVEQKFKGLTKGDLRLFLMIHSGLDKEELAAFLGITDEGVRKAKYRLKTRVGLSEDESIEDFILHF